MSGSLLGQLIFDGLAIGLVFVILCCGMVIITSIAKILFLAYGAFYTIGAYGTWYAITYLHIHYWFGLILGVIIAGIIGVASYFLIFQRLKLRMGARAFMPTLIGSVALQMLLTQAGVLLYGNMSRSIPNVFPGVFHPFGINITFAKIVLIAVSVVVCVALFYLYQRTAIGRSMRAVSYIPDAAALQGINVNRVYIISMGIATVLAGIAGAILAPSYGMDPLMGSNVIWTVMLINQLGGMGSLLGALVAGVIVGQALSWGMFFMGSLIQLVIFVGIMIVVYFRPYGLLGKDIDLGI
jgi:branched-chain amino acid transport system permease protein